MRFDHVAVPVPDVGAAVDWYLAEIPGAEVRYRDETWALVEAGGVRLALVTPGQHPPHVAWRVSLDRLEAIAGARGVPIARHRDGSRSVYVSDPGGNAVEIVAYPEGDPA